MVPERRAYGVLQRKSGNAMTDAERIAYELSEDEGKVGTHKLHARSCSICHEKIKHGQQRIRVYTRPKHSKASRRKAVMHEYHYQRTRQERKHTQSETDGEKGADMAGVQIKPKLISYFRQHPGIDVYADDIMNALGETKERVMGGMTNIMNPNQRNSEAVREFAQHTEKRGTGVWRYRPPNILQGSERERPSKRLFTEVGSTKDGSLVLECEDGKLFMAEEM